MLKEKLANKNMAWYTSYHPPVYLVLLQSSTAFPISNKIAVLIKEFWVMGMENLVTETVLQTW